MGKWGEGERPEVNRESESVGERSQLRRATRGFPAPASSSIWPTA